MNRRRFLQTAGWAVAGPLILPRRLFGADAPSKKIGIGLISSLASFKTGSIISALSF